MRKHGVVVEGEMQEIQERMVHMCNLGEGILEQGIAQGIAQGERQTVFSLVANKRLAPEVGAEELGISVSELLEAMAEAGFSIKN